MEWVTSENIYDESWRRLLEFANVELAIEAISSIHGKASKSTLPNYKKQAEQARVALLQAKEYFEAAKVSSLYTQPNHLYYGSVALSTACMLVRGDGKKSLDVLRQNSKNSSHGLDFTFSSDIRQSKIGLNLLDSSYVKIHPNGHFSNWYSTLLSTQNLTAVKHLRMRQGSRRNMAYIGSFQISEFSDLKGMKKDLMFLLARLPDLYSDLGRYGVNLDSARGELNVYHDEIANQEYKEFVFHSSPSPESFLKVIENFVCEAGVNFEYGFFDGSNSGFVRSRKDKRWEFSFPDSRTTMDHQTIYYAEPLGTPEVVDLFLVCYALSMLSRYFPDVWVSFLESHCKGAKLVERIVRVLTLKMPNLMLNQMTGTELVISNHRPPWH